MVFDLPRTCPVHLVTSEVKPPNIAPITIPPPETVMKLRIAKNTCFTWISVAAENVVIVLYIVTTTAS